MITIEGRYARLESPQQDTDLASAEPMDVDDTSPEKKEMIAWDVVGWEGIGDKDPDFSHFSLRLTNRWNQRRSGRGDDPDLPSTASRLDILHARFVSLCKSDCS